MRITVGYGDPARGQVRKLIFCWLWRPGPWPGAEAVTQIIMNLRDDGMTFRWSVSSSGPERRLQARMRVRSECRIAKPPINGPRATGGQPLR